jgi:hypothetical protein
MVASSDGSAVARLHALIVTGSDGQRGPQKSSAAMAALLVA